MGATTTTPNFWIFFSVWGKSINKTFSAVRKLATRACAPLSLARLLHCHAYYTRLVL